MIEASLHGSCQGQVTKAAHMPLCLQPQVWGVTGSLPWQLQDRFDLIVSSKGGAPAVKGFKGALGSA